jgi:DNA-binding GntR family transcriptional regulator
VTRKRDPFTMALESLRTRAEQGVYAPGGPVVIIDEARRLKLSTTPVREALGWLCGYGLIERAPSGGFLAPRLDAAVVRDRLAFRLHCLATALNGAGQVHRARSNGSVDAGGLDLAAHMSRAVRETGSAALVDAYQRVDSQLVQLAQAERRVFKDLDAEAEMIVRLFEGAPGEGLPQALTLYHHRRMEAAPLLIMEAEAGRGLASPEP